MPARLSRHWIPLAALLSLAGVGTAAADQNVAFITVALDPDTKAADALLSRYLRSRTGLQFEPKEVEYAEAIRQVAEWKGDQPYVARLTPYVYVAAEMLGASFETLGTYNSKATEDTVYRSYFVVRRDRFGAERPDLNDLLAFLRRQPARFIYHSEFSTSSYFVPALFFRRARVFATNEATDSREGIIPIQAEKRGDGSGSLVTEVAEGRADVAAVGDGTRKAVEGTAQGERVYFIPLPELIPNDLLVCSRALPKEEIDKLRTAIRGMRREGGGEIATGDFRWWDEFKDADAARQALAGLRHLAAQQPAPVTVVVRGESDEGSTAVETLAEAARQAVRLSGSEFVLYDPDAHVHKDVTWTIRPIHDGAVELIARIEGSKLAAQQFQVSFTDLSDLTKRIGGLLHGRMHRIRYVWPYDAKNPTIVRDVDFSMPMETMLEARRITWLNPERNHFREGDLFPTVLKGADFFKFSLDPANFPRAAGGDGFASDPMSNVAYRVVLVRPASEPFVLTVLTTLFVALLALGAVACFVDLRRKEPRARKPVIEPLGVPQPVAIPAMEQTR